MDKTRVDMFLASMGSKFPNDKLMVMREHLLSLDDNRLLVIQSAEYKDPTTLLIISIFLGHFGVDRFMLGDTGMGVGKLLTCGGLGIWTIIDFIMIMDATREKNYQQFLKFAF